MQRRHFLALATPLLAGCGSTASTDPSDSDGEADPEPGTEPSGVSSVDLAAEGLQAADADVSLEIRYNSHATKELPAGQYTTIADDGEKWLTVRMDVTNTGDSQRELIVRHYTVATGGEEYEVVYFDEEHSLRGKTVAPGETVTGWVFFSIPISATEATLKANQGDLTRFNVAFTQDSSLSATPPDG